MASFLCDRSDLVANSGICALYNNEQLAIFYLPDTERQVFAVSNWDPVGKANVMSRGIVGNLDDELVVASPLYKQHYSLLTGECLEEEASLTVYSVSLLDDAVMLSP